MLGRVDLVQEYAQVVDVLDLSAHRSMRAWYSKWGGDGEHYTGEDIVHCSVNRSTYDPLVVVARVLTSWTARGVQEVVDDVDDGGDGGPIVEEAGDTELGAQVRSARLWCHSIGCSSVRSCIHTRMVMHAFGYVATPQTGAEQ